MKRSSNKFVILFVLIAVIAACSFAWSQSNAYPSATWHYKLTVNIDTPEGIKTGSVIRGVSTGLQSNIANVPAYIGSFGEAAVVDLGKRGVLFGIFRPSDGYQIALNALPGPPAATIEGMEYYSKLKAKAVLKPDNYPMFVRFKKIDDPKSVIAVVPNKDASVERVPDKDNVETLEEAFGQNVSIKDITIETTNEPVTSGIAEKYLPWLVDFYKSKIRLNGKKGAISTNELADNLSAGSFKWEKRSD